MERLHRHYSTQWLQPSSKVIKNKTTHTQQRGDKMHLRLLDGVPHYVQVVSRTVFRRCGKGQLILRWQNVQLQDIFEFFLCPAGFERCVVIAARKNRHPFEKMHHHHRRGCAYTLYVSVVFTANIHFQKRKAAAERQKKTTKNVTQHPKKGAP